MAMMTSASKV